MHGMNTAEHATGTTTLVSMVQDYATLIKKGNQQQADCVLQEIQDWQCGRDKKPSSSDEDLYSKVGKLTRELHESINNFMSDDRLTQMTSEAMPDARQRLNHVVELTEQSAHKTMTLIEHSNPLMRVLADRSAVLLQQIQAHGTQNNINNDAKTPGYLDEELSAFLHLVAVTSKAVSADLNEIMMAQDYQDLTGQVINRVSALVQEVENNLLGLLQFSNDTVTDNAVTMAVDNSNKSKPENDRAGEENNKGFGPAVPGVTHGDVVQSQEDVDDLLSSLGF